MERPQQHQGSSHLSSILFWARRELGTGPQSLPLAVGQDAEARPPPDGLCVPPKPPQESTLSVPTPPSASRQHGPAAPSTRGCKSVKKYLWKPQKPQKHRELLVLSVSALCATGGGRGMRPLPPHLPLTTPEHPQPSIKRRRRGGDAAVTLGEGRTLLLHSPLPPGPWGLLSPGEEQLRPPNPRTPCSCRVPRAVAAGDKGRAGDVPPPCRCRGSVSCSTEPIRKSGEGLWGPKPAATVPPGCFGTAEDRTLLKKQPLCSRLRCSWL